MSATVVKDNSDFGTRLQGGLYSLEINPNWHEAGHFPPPCPFWIKYLAAEFLLKISKLFWVNLTPCQAH